MRDRRNRERIRDNQRRSRARRREYVRELEQRLRMAEQRGTQASVELQAAARRVAEENARLRRLLRLRFGVVDRAIDAYLASEESTTTAATACCSSSSSRMNEGCGNAPPGPGPELGPEPEPEPAVRRLERLLPPRPGACAGALNVATPTHTTTATPSSDQDEGDKNNCALAADLISTMTGANPHEVRASLGCAPGTDCHVDDAKIGSAIERFTGSEAVA